VDALARAWSVGSHEPGPQMLVNGDFSQAKSGWELFLKPPAAARFEVTDEGYDDSPCAKITIENVTDTRWHVMLTQRRLKLRGDKAYRVVFYARASTPRNLSVEVCHDGPWRGYGNGRFEITSDWRRYEFTFRTDEDDDSVRMSFHLGEATGVVWIDDVILQEAPIYGLHEREDPWSSTVHRLQPEEFTSYTLARFRDEALFYFELEKKYYSCPHRGDKSQLRPPEPVGSVVYGSDGLSRVLAASAFSPSTLVSHRLVHREHAYAR